MVLAAFGGGAVAGRVVGVGAQGGARAPMIIVSELSTRLPPSEFSFLALFSQSGAGSWVIKRRRCGLRNPLGALGVAL